MRATSRPPPLPEYDQPPAPTPTISGRPATGPGVLRATTGCPACGARRPTTARSGPRPTGAGTAATIVSITVTGDPTSASTEASTTASATLASATSAATGEGMTSITTARSTTSATSTTRMFITARWSTTTSATPPSLLNRVSYNGGHGGVNVAPRPTELAAMHESHARPVAAQTQVASRPPATASSSTTRTTAVQPRPRWTRPAGESEPGRTSPKLLRASTAGAATQCRGTATQCARSNSPASRRRIGLRCRQPGATQQRIVAPRNIHRRESHATQTQQRRENRPEATPNSSRDNADSPRRTKAASGAYRAARAGGATESRPQPTPRPESAPRRSGSALQLPLARPGSPLLARNRSPPASHSGPSRRMRGTGSSSPAVSGSSAPCGSSASGPSRARSRT